MRVDRYTTEEMDFIKHAEHSIDDNPLSRLSDRTLKVLSRGNFVIDGHCHAFDGGCIEVKYFVVRMIGAVPQSIIKRAWRLLTHNSWERKFVHYSKSELINEVLRNDNMLSEISISAYFKFLMDETAIELKLIDTVHVLDKASETWMYFLRRLRFIVSILSSKDMDNVYTAFSDYFAINNQLEDKELISIVIGSNLGNGWTGNIEKTFKEQTDELLDLSQKEAVIPFLPIDLSRIENKAEGSNELFDVFLEAFNKYESSCYFGIEINPALGYLPSDPRLKAIYEVCARKNIPVIGNCGDDFFFLKAEDENARLKNMSYNEPKEWIPVLEKFENLRLNLAHFGGLSAWANENAVTRHRIEHILSMMNKYNVYSDFSFSCGDEKALGYFSELINAYSENARLMVNRCFYGSDFWLSIPTSDLRHCQESFISKVEDYQDKMFYVNALRFLGLDEFASKNRSIEKGTSQTSAPY